MSGNPPPIAVEITPEQPLSDITLELNETVSIKFPGGTTNRIKKNGKWRYRILKNPGLPEGLTFDHAERTLSGTPVEEHDATHSYRIRYVWGRNQADQEKLVAQFRLVVKKTDPIAARIRAFIGEASLVEEASSVGEFAKGLPDLHKRHSLYMIKSQALDSSFVSEEYPRMIAFGADARTIFAWGSDPDSDRYDLVEFIAAGERRWHFGVIDFAEDPPVVTRDPEECQTCHHNRPLWANYQEWPGTLFELNKLGEEFVRSWNYDNKLYWNFQQSPDPRISSVGGASFIRTTEDMPRELGNQLAIRHGELLARQVIAQPDDFRAVAEKLVCGGYRVVYAHWPKREIDLSRMGTGDGGLVLINPNDRTPPPPYASGNAILERIIMLLIINHLYETDSEIQAIYDSTSNTDTSPRFPSYLHYAPGTATAADELRSRVELVRLAGQANYDKRRAHRFLPAKDMVLGEGHLYVMAPKVCNALRARNSD